MITYLSVENFKSWENAPDLRMAPLTAFFGANGSGKSSILQVLLMLKQTTERPLDWNEPLYFGDENSLVNLGSFDKIIYQHNNSIRLGIYLSWTLPRKLNVADQYETDALSFCLDTYEDSVWTSYYDCGDTHYLARTFGIGWSEFETPIVDGAASSLFRCYGIRAKSGKTPRLYADLEKAFEALFAKIQYLGPVGFYPQPSYTWDMYRYAKGVGKHGEEAIPALLSSSRANYIAYEYEDIEEEQILLWLKQLGLIHSFRLLPDYESTDTYDFLVRPYENAPEVHLPDAGFGVSQVLPVLILCDTVPEGSILILEQPEAHLHPKIQSELADVLVDAAKKRRLQIILESHSEPLIHRLTRRIAEEHLSPDDIALYACQKHEGTSEIEELQVDDYGNISNWPQNFFGDEMDDLAAKAKAEIDRRKANKQWR